MLFQRQFEINERSQSQDSQNARLPHQQQYVLSWAWTISKLQKQRISIRAWLGFLWSREKERGGQRNKRTHANVKITILSYDERLTWLYTSKAKKLLFSFFWACLFFRNGKIQISTETTFHRIVRSGWRKIELLRKL